MTDSTIKKKHFGAEILTTKFEYSWTLEAVFVALIAVIQCIHPG